MLFFKPALFIIRKIKNMNYEKLTYIDEHIYKIKTHFSYLKILSASVNHNFSFLLHLIIFLIGITFFRIFLEEIKKTTLSLSG